MVFYILVLLCRTDCQIPTHIATPFTNCTEKSRLAEFTYRLQFVQGELRKIGTFKYVIGVHRSTVVRTI